MLVAVAEVVLAELPGGVALRLQGGGDGRVLGREAEGSAGHADLGETGAVGVLAADEGGPARRAALLAVVVGEAGALVGQAVDVRGAVPHEPVAVAAEVGDADVVSPDDQDVRLVGHGRSSGWWGQGRRRAAAHRSGRPWGRGVGTLRAGSYHVREGSSPGAATRSPRPPGRRRHRRRSPAAARGGRARGGGVGDRASLRRGVPPLAADDLPSPPRGPSLRRGARVPGQRRRDDALPPSRAHRSAASVRRSLAPAPPRHRKTGNTRWITRSPWMQVVGFPSMMSSPAMGPK